MISVLHKSNFYHDCICRNVSIFQNEPPNSLVTVKIAKMDPITSNKPFPLLVTGVRHQPGLIQVV